MALDASVRLRVGALDLDAQLACADGETVAVLGPNGAGKTTLLRALAGLLPLEHGTIVVDGVTLDDPRAGVFVPPERRSVGVVFQDYLLFPHLDVRENIAFGLRSRGVDRHTARHRAADWSARLGLGDRMQAHPRELSGGQQQRVALARALVTEPRLLLLDEPLAALDAGTRLDVRRSLHDELERFGGARVVVTHDLLDAVALADRLVVLEHGRVAQEGTVADVAARPRSRYVADLVGLNLLRGTGIDHAVVLATGGRVVTAEPVDGDVYVAIHPRAVALHREHPEGSARNVWRGRVDGADLLGDRMRLHVQSDVPLVAEITTPAAAELGLHVGVEVWASVKATEVTTYAA